MRVRRPLKYLGIFGLLVALLLWSRSLHRISQDALRNSSVIHATVAGGWFPALDRRLRFGAPDTWRLPSDHLKKGAGGESNPSKDSEMGESVREAADLSLNNVFLMLKTGADVMWDRLPIHLETTFTRFPNHQIYADTESQIGDESIVDVIGMLPEALIGDHQLQGYRLRRSLVQDAWGWDANDVKMEMLEGWNLDKFKNVPMLLHAYRNAPKSTQWFVYLDDDSYIHTASLQSLLSGLNPADQHYIGSAALIMGGFAEAGERGAALKAKSKTTVGLWFAHGGSGIVLSRGALDALFWDPQREDHTMAKYAQWAVHTCCGDAALGFMLREELDLAVNSLLDPLEMSVDPLQGERLDNTKISASAGGWCSRIISWHHLESWEIQKLWDWEASLAIRKSPEALFHPGILFSDFYNDFILPYIQPLTEHWDNHASSLYFSWNTPFSTEPGTLETPGDEYDAEFDEEAAIFPASSAEVCRETCRQTPKCLGWKYEFLPTNNTCSHELHYVVKGRSRNVFGTEEDYAVVSGWEVDRIREIRSGEVCDTLEYDEESEEYSDDVSMREGWYFERLLAEQDGDTQKPVYHLASTA